MRKKRSAGTAVTMDQMADREIGALARSEFETGGHPAGTSADGMTPVVAALLSLDRDLTTVLRECEEIRRRVEAFETFARALRACMGELRKGTRW